MHYCTPRVPPPVYVSHGPPASLFREALQQTAGPDSTASGNSPNSGPSLRPPLFSLLTSPHHHKAPRLDTITHGFRLTQRSTARLNRVYQLYTSHLPVRLVSYCLSLPALPNTSPPTLTPWIRHHACCRNTNRANGQKAPRTSDAPDLWHQGNTRSGSAWRKGPAGRLVFEIHALERLFFAYSANDIRPYTTVMRRSLSTLSPIYDLSRAELYRLPVITAQTFFACYGSFQPTEPLLILSPANHLRQIHVICMSNHDAYAHTLEARWSGISRGISLGISSLRPAMPRLASHLILTK
jgi:hypothetical protein